MTDFDRFLLLTAIDYYLRNKEPDPIAEMYLTGRRC